MLGLAGAPVLLTGIGLPDDGLHSPNEKLDLENFHNGVIASAYLYREIAGVGRRSDAPGAPSPSVS